MERGCNTTSTVPGASKVRVQDVSKHLVQHGQRLTVLHGVHLYAAAGEFVSIIGPSGCGKSTLLNIIAGHSQPSSGAIYLDERPTAHRTRLRRLYATKGLAAALA